MSKLDTLDPRAWLRTPEALAILADCVANPPSFVSRKLSAHERWSRDDEMLSQFNRNDDRVDALIHLSNRAFEAAEKAGASRDVLRRWPSHDEAIRAAIAAAHRKVAA